jgi:predicted N-acyltransferase
LIANGRGGDSGLVSELANESGSHFSINTVTDTTTDSITSLLSEFYEVYSCNMHYLGSPALGKIFFKTLLEEYCNGKARIFVAKKDGKPIGASISLSYLNTTENIHFSSLRKMNSYYPSYLLHYEMMNQAISDGSTIYSFGRSTRDSGVHKYKQQWEVQDKTIYYNYTRNPGLSLRDLSILTTLWKKLPYALHKKVGSYIAGRVY